MTWNGQFCMAKIKYTLKQGNFYERLPFYIDSCAISPTASLLSSYQVNESVHKLVIALLHPLTLNL